MISGSCVWDPDASDFDPGKAAKKRGRRKSSFKSEAEKYSKGCDLR
jgi:hypothetical protein